MTSSPLVRFAAHPAHDRFAAFFERNFKLCAALLVAFLLVCGLARDLRKKLWIDELYTLYMAQQPSLTQIVKATVEGCDGAPPLYASLVHALLPWVRNDGLAVRLPSTLGYCAATVLLLAFCRRRMPAVYAFVAATLFASAALPYAAEGRCYGLVLGCCAGALLAWQAVAGGRRRSISLILLALSLAAATALHYYAIFFAAALFLGETIRPKKSRKLDLAVLAVFSLPLLVLAAHLPLIQAGRRFQAHYWAAASWFNLVDLAGFSLMLAPLALLILSPLIKRTPRTPGLTGPEWVASAAISLAPLCILILSIYVTHVWVFRYVLWAQLGMAILVAAVLFHASAGAKVIGVAALTLVFALLGISDVAGVLKRPLLFKGQAVFQALRTLPPGSQPIVIADHQVFMELAYYEPQPLRSRLLYAVDPALDLRYFHQNTGALLMTAWSQRNPQLPIVDYAAFRAAHAHFILAALPADYLPGQLARDGYRVVAIRSSAPAVLYQVDAAPPQASVPAHR